MKKIFNTLLLLSFLLLVYSCTAQLVNSTPKYVYEKDAINLRLKADPQLNLYQGNPYTLVLCVYQLTTPNAFHGLTKDQVGLSKLLECNRFDPSVASFKTLIIHPGRELIEILDRAEGAQYVAVVAGYYHLQKDHVVRLFEVPVIEEVQGVIRRTKTLKPGPMNINLYLGPQEIQELSTDSQGQ